MLGQWRMFHEKLYLRLTNSPLAAAAAWDMKVTPSPVRTRAMMTDQKRSTYRREFLKLGVASAFGGLLPARALAAGITTDAAALYRQVIPAKKKLDAAWAASLLRRDHAMDSAIRSAKKEELPHIGMTVGGIGCGTVYLSGDGRLYIWDIFHQPHEGVVAATTNIPNGFENIAQGGKKVRERDGANYLVPPTADQHPGPFRQGFRLQIEGTPERSFNGKAWENVSFVGEWPVGRVAYRDKDCPLEVDLLSWTPFVPLSLDDSSWPVTVMEFTARNRSDKPVRGTIAGDLDNPVFSLHGPVASARSGSAAVKEPGVAMLAHSSRLPEGAVEATKRGDFGTMVLAALDESATVKAETMGSVSCAIDLAPGEEKTFSFFFAWHFPNGGKLPGPGVYRPLYTKRHQSADAVALAFAKDHSRLRDLTLRWVKTWQDSTLPRWLLDRAILTTNTLQTTNCHFLENGRFWAWEGVGCCPGTCAHVWHYAQGVARLFPEIERNLREITDYGVAIKDDGSIPFRAEAAKTVAIDSQTSTLLRTWREHLVSKDDAFLRRVWPAAKRALEWLIRFDANGRGGLDGLLDGEQHNTLDAEWYGKVHCLCSLYLASLAAGKKIAEAVGDKPFAAECDRVLALGAEGMKKLFNGEFYIQEEDPAHAKAIGVGTGCYIDQVIGQWWAHVVGLGRIYDEAHIHSALHALWRYNFSPEIGSFRKVFPRGRFYAMPGEAGLLMCTWPKGGLREDFTKHWQYAYFNECMTGFEWQAAAHMIQEGEALSAADAESLAALIDGSDDGRALTARGLAVARAIHDRYAPSRRNPYNEIECSDHYARANASYSVFLAACGFNYDGPAGRIGFAPKLQPEDFRAAFTAADGWGTFAQKRGANGKWSASLALSHGRLMLRELDLPWLNDGAVVKTGDRTLPGQVSQGRWTAAEPILLEAGKPSLVVSG